MTTHMAQALDKNINQGEGGLSEACEGKLGTDPMNRALTTWLRKLPPSRLHF